MSIIPKNYRIYKSKRFSLATFLAMLTITHFVWEVNNQDLKSSTLSQTQPFQHKNALFQGSKLRFGMHLLTLLGMGDL